MEDKNLFRKESILLNTIDVINEYGIQSVSTKEIAKRMNVSEGTIFKYFPKKSDLLYAVLEHYFQYDADIFATIRSKEMEPKEAIIFFIDSYMSYFANYPQITVISQSYDMLMYIPELKDKVRDMFINRLEFIKELIEKAQRAGVLSNDVDSGSLAEIISSACRGICLRWRMSGYSFPLREKALDAVSMLLDAFSDKKR